MDKIKNMSMKRLWCISVVVITVIFLIMIFPIDAVASNVISGTLGDSNGIQWTYDTETMTLVVSGKDSGLQGSYWGSQFKTRSAKKIILRDCTLIGDASWLFYKFSELESVECENVDTSQVTDMSKMFQYCSKLKNIDTSEFDTSQVTNMDRMFCECSSLESVDVSNFNTSNVTDMQFMFSDCSNLRELDVSCFDTSKVTDMTAMFRGCNELTELNVGSFDTSSVINMHSMFLGCRALPSLDLGNFETTQVTDMSYMFEYCSNLEYINLDNFETAQVKSMSYMFSSCEELMSLDLSSFNTSQVTDMQSMFWGCSNLRELDLSGFDTSKVTDMHNMFAECTNLKDLNISNLDTSQVITTEYMFSGCSSLEKLDIGNFDTCNVNSMKAMFSDCQGLKELDVNEFDTSQVTNMDFMFSRCSSLKELNLNKWDTSKVNSMWSMFQGCSSLLSLDLSNFETSQVTNMWYMFQNCSSLVDADLSGFDITNTEIRGNIESMFYNCDELKILHTPKKMTESQSIILPGEFMDSSQNKTSLLTDEFCDMVLSRETEVILVEEIVLNEHKIDVEVGKTYEIKANVMPKYAFEGDLIWTTSNEVVATVNEDGVITAGAIGEATITATAKDGSGVSATCMVTVVELEKNPFVDVKQNSWQYTYVKYALDNNIMGGKGKDTEGNIIFDPDNNMTRAEFVQSLYNKEGKPTVTYSNKFTDVPEGAWYASAILWASEKNIVAGKGDKFDVSGNITREEVATILYKYATNYKKYKTAGRIELSGYEDVESISDWAVNNMKWAIRYGIMKGRGALLAPRDNATRAECATMLKNFMDAYGK